MTTQVNENGSLIRDDRYTDSIVLLESSGETVYPMGNYGVTRDSAPSHVINTMASAIHEDKGIDINTGYTARQSGTNFYILAKPQQG